MTFSVSASQMSEYFRLLRSSDASVRQQAQRDAWYYVKPAYSQLASEIPALKTGLTGSDSYIRLQASGVVRTALMLDPTSSRHFASLVPDLIKAASDVKPDVGENALASLAIFSPSAPKEAEQTFVAAFDLPFGSAKPLAALGILRLENASEAAQKRLGSALKAARSDQELLSLLQVFSQGRFSDPDVLSALMSNLGHSNRGVRLAAAEALRSAKTMDRKTKDAVQNKLIERDTEPLLRERLELLLKTQK